MLERDLFFAAWDIDDAIERQGYLDSACINNTTLRNRLERLLNHAREDSDFLNQPAADLCSDWDSAWIGEPSGVPLSVGEPLTQTGAAGDTGQTLLLNPLIPVASASSTEVLSSSPLGMLFGRYRLGRILGAGGMGIVYLAEDMRLGRRVALKIPKFDVDGKLHLIERFRREARTMASVLHRHLCPIFDVAEQDGQHYLTMAFIDGETLGQALKRGATFSTRQIADLVRKLALALEAAHQAGVVHRDLKPANVMIDRSGEPIVMDFGLAWMVHETDARVTQSGAIIGTPAYMSPEQAEGDPDQIGAASDIYSLGAMLYELLAGRPIHTGSVTHVLYQLRHDDPTRPSVIRRDIDPQLEAVCWKAIARRPEDRFATAGEFAEALAGILADCRDSSPLAPAIDLPFTSDSTAGERARVKGLHTTSRPLTPALSPTVTSAPKSTPIEGEREQAPEPPRRSRTALAGFAALVFLAAVLLITTRNGSVEVTSPDGKLPDDVKVVVTRGGEEIELLQADNQWSAKLVNGEYQVQLRGGEDRFEITTSQLTINRLGRAVVKLEMRPPVAVPQPGPVVVGLQTPPQPPTEPAKPPLPLNIDDKQAKAHQADWAKKIGVPVEYTNSIGMKFVLIPPGEFMMGGTPAEIAAHLNEIKADSQWQERIQSEAPQHKVVLTRPIYLGVHEVTQKEYETIKETNPAHFSPSGAGQAAVANLDTQNHPVEKVSWNQAIDFCAKLNETENVKPYSIRLGKVVVPLIGDGYGLPTEALWEYACRAGSPTKFWMGDVEADLSRVSWFDQNSGGRTHAVGEFPANPFGLHDLHGNVWEWVQDVWESKYYSRFSETPAINPLASPSDIPDFPDIPETPRRVVRGGGFGDPAWFCRSSCRHAFDPAQRYLALGFRVSLTVDVVKAAIAKRTPQPITTPPPVIGPHMQALTGTGSHLPLAPISATITPVGPTYVKSATGFTGTWAARTPPEWRGTFTGLGFLPRDNTGSHSTRYDFSGLPHSVLPAGTYFALTDLDTVEYLTLKAYDSTHTALSTPWLNLHPLSQWGQGTGTGSPGEVLPTDMPGWEWNPSIQTYVFEGIQIVGNPNISFALSSREDIAFLEVSREVTGFNFHLMAPAADPVPSGLPVESPRPAIAPFDHKRARTHQVAWAEQLGVPVEYTNTIGMQFILIPPGEFMMGSTSDEIVEAVAAFTPTDDQTWPDFFRTEAPQHTVRLTKPYYLGVYEVTQAEYEQVLGKDRNHSCFAPLSFGSNDVIGRDSTRHPVEMVSWYDAAEFCATLSQKEKMKPFYMREGEAVTPLEGTGYRLPTESQWEFACRAGTTSKYSTGDRIADLDAMGWFSLNSQGRTHAVGEKNANPFGLYDMHGNVEEWCQDHYAAYSEAQLENPSVTSTTETRRVTRGGFWTFMWPLCRSSHRFARTPESQFNYTGFRVVLEVEAVKAAIADRTP